MLKNYLKIAFRNVRKYLGYSFINIIGLSIALTSLMLFVLYSYNELSYDKYHEDSDKIYRITTDINFKNYQAHTAATLGGLAQALSEELPEVKSGTRIQHLTPFKKIVSYKNNRFYEDRFYLTDPSIFDIFTFKFLKGNPETAFNGPYSLVITESIANKYFGVEDPIGKTITYENTIDFTVTAILENIPKNSHFKFDLLSSTTGCPDLHMDSYENQWIDINYWVYIELADNYPLQEIEGKCNILLKQYQGEADQYFQNDVRPLYRLILQPLHDIHLFSHVSNEFEANGHIHNIYYSAILGFIILLICAINFTNLTVALSLSRTKEITMRKVVGAKRKQLITQFTGESVFLSFLALPVALIGVHLLLPTLNRMIDSELSLLYFWKWQWIVGLIAVTLTVGVISGMYPSFVISAFRPILLLKNTNLPQIKKTSVRNVLVIIQLVFSIIFIICSLGIYRQLQYVKNKQLGFDKEQIVVVDVADPTLFQNYETFRSELLKNPNIVNVAASSGTPAKIQWKHGVSWEGMQSEDFQLLDMLAIDFDFIDTYDMQLSSGRKLDRDFSTDINYAFLLNETAIKYIDWNSPIGKRFQATNREGEVIGVVRDFNFEPLYQPIKPLVLHYWPERFRVFSVKILPENVQRTLAFLKSSWEKFDPLHPFEFSFLDDELDRFYQTEERTQKLFIFCTFIAIFVSCLGLLGLSSFIIKRRTKEVGIRKVLGASISGIMLLLSREFLKWILLATLISWPLAYFVLQRWLQSFAYRIDIGFWLFILSSLLALLIALLTISYHAIKAAQANPVDSLRYE